MSWRIQPGSHQVCLQTNPIDSVDFILDNFILLKKRLKVERMNSDETESETPGPTPLPDHRVLQPAWRRRQPRVTKPVEPGTLRGFEERLFCNFAFPCIAAASNIASLRLLTKLTLSFFGACLSHQAQNDSTWSRHGAPCLAEMSGWSWVKDFANCHCVWLCLTVSVCLRCVYYCVCCVLKSGPTFHLQSHLQVQLAQGFEGDEPPSWLRNWGQQHFQHFQHFNLLAWWLNQNDACRSHVQSMKTTQVDSPKLASAPGTPWSLQMVP